MQRPNRQRRENAILIHAQESKLRAGLNPPPDRTNQEPKLLPHRPESTAPVKVRLCLPRSVAAPATIITILLRHKGPNKQPAVDDVFRKEMVIRRRDEREVKKLS